MSSELIQGHPPIPASPEAQERVEYAYISHSYGYIYIYL
jgi:hypothetical protein